ncbi:MAG: sensor histidine kinase [Cyclobacteriaceae bacterium]
MCHAPNGRSDPDRLKMILSNLLFNAVKYSDLKKNERWVRVEASQPNGSWKLSIHDNGIGVREEHQNRIFDMFYRAHTGYEGSGLGLYIVKEAVTKLDGQIALTSAEGEGTQVEILFPGT